MLIKIAKNVELLLNHAQVMYSLLFFLITLLLYSIFVLSGVIVKNLFSTPYHLYW
ncbi:MAG: hypothetical protein H6Q72_2317 [Firmicutes bacterium]|nr:hypothetical protein [Bacillota bacterium]